MARHKGQLPPVVILGGSANALSIARSLGREGIKVYAIVRSGAHARYSRFCEWVPVPKNGSVEESGVRFLLGPEADHLQGAVLLTGSDGGIEVIARHRHRLLERFRLDESNPEAQLCMLNKLCTYETARIAGVP